MQNIKLHIYHVKIRMSVCLKDWRVTHRNEYSFALGEFLFLVSKFKVSLYLK